MISDSVHHVVVETSLFTPLNAVKYEAPPCQYSSIVLLISCTQRKIKDGVLVELAIADSTFARTLRIWRTTAANLLGGCVLIISNYTISQGGYITANSNTIITVLLHPKRDQAFYRELVASLSYAKVPNLDEVALLMPVMRKYPKLCEHLAQILRWTLSTDFALLITRYVLHESHDIYLDCPPHIV